MNQQIKKRIEQIRRGEVPEGYKKTDAGIAPSGWNEFLLGEIFTERKSAGNPDLPVLSVSIHSGVSDGELDEDALGKKVKRIADKTQYKTARSGDLVFNMMRAWQGAIGIASSDGLVSPAYIVAVPNEKVFPQYMDDYMKTPRMISTINRQSYGVTDFRKRLYWDSFALISCTLPSIAEQQKIAAILTTQDKVVELKEKLLAEKQWQKKHLCHQLLTGKKRLPGFSQKWSTIELGEVFRYSQPTPYLVSNTNYSDDYTVPVLTAGKTFILGYTNEQSGIFDLLPVVIFDDFTIDSKYVDFPFKVKSSAMKILSVNDGYNIKFAYEAMQLVKYTVANHERHWISKFSTLTIDVPSLDEQNAIETIITTAIHEIDLLQKSIEAEKQKKKALMQLLLTGIVRIKV